MSESGGRVYANDGLAFHPDPAVRRPGWDTDDNGKPLSPAVLARCYAAVRASLACPHTGILQQLSQETWGWGILADTMDIDRACRMFLDRLVVTANRSYRGRDFDPIAADVLRVQQPLVSESSSSNYGQDKVDAAKAIVDNWNPDYFKDSK